MLVARVETLEKQLAILLKDTKVPNNDVKTKKEPKSKKSKDDVCDDEVEVKKPKKSKKVKDDPSSE
ncbi:MAG: hypothetical protein ACK559_41165, partial [bacterium]